MKCACCFDSEVASFVSCLFLADFSVPSILAVIELETSAVVGSASGVAAVSVVLAFFAAVGDFAVIWLIFVEAVLAAVVEISMKTAFVEVDFVAV